MKKPVVAHFCPSYLPLSETFIYRYLSNFSDVKPIVFSLKKQNLDLFPLDTKIFEVGYKRFTFRWVLNGIIGRLTGDYNVYRNVLVKLFNGKVLHAHFGPTGYDLLKFKFASSLPLVTTFYGCDMSRLAQRVEWRDRYTELFEKGDLFLVEGTNMKNGLAALGCPEEKIKIQHIAIDLKQFRFRERHAKSDGVVTILFCGRFTEKKGLIYALMALKEVIRDFPAVQLRIIGDGKLRSEVQSYISRNGLEKHAIILGMQPHHVVVKEMEEADIFIQPSVTAMDGDSEGGAPTIILEAQASGTPVLSTYHADIPEVVVPGKSALLAKERDWQGLANNMVYLIENQNEWIRMGLTGRRHVEENYNICTQVKEMERTYFQLLS